jgi:prepilin-type N-terminal cleavage/methylation domain-containing protein
MAGDMPGWQPFVENATDAVRCAKRGFALIEFVVVIVVLGVIFLMTMKGAEMVTTMRAVVTSHQIAQIQTKVAVYQNDYRALPGDDPRGEVRYKHGGARGLENRVLVNRTGNDQIDGHLSDYSSPDAEPFMAWRDLRYAGKLDGDPTLQGIAALPENPFGGFYGFDAGNLGQKRGSLCATKVPGRAALLIDEKIDDGRINTGKMVATSKFSVEENNHFDAPDVEPYNVEKEYIICVPMLP